MVTDANLFTRDNLNSLAKKRRGPELIIGCIYKFKVFKLSPILSFYTSKGLWIKFIIIFFIRAIE